MKENKTLSKALLSGNFSTMLQTYHRMRKGVKQQVKVFILLCLVTLAGCDFTESEPVITTSKPEKRKPQLEQLCGEIVVGMTVAEAKDMFSHDFNKRWYKNGDGTGHLTYSNPTSLTGDIHSLSVEELVQMRDWICRVHFDLQEIITSKEYFDSSER